MATRPIKISIIGDDSQLRKSLKNANKSLAGFGKSIAKVGLTSGVAFAGVAAAVATKGVTAFADFEKGMNEVMTLLPGAGEEVFGELSDQVKDFSKEFGVLPDKAIPALYSALSAGVPKENVFEFMEVAQKAAKGGVAELEVALDGISSVVNSYGAEVIGATEASDLMFTAVRLGKTTFEEISASIFQMAPIASAVGIPFKDLTASIANLTASGTPTAVAATQMKAAMAELGKEGTKADVAFRELTNMGLQQFLEEEGNFASAMITMKEGADEAGISVLDMFGSIEAGQGVLALTADGGDKFLATLGEMNASAGATEAAFQTMDTGLSANFDKIKANLSVLAIDIGEKLAPHVARASEMLMEGFEKLGPFIEQAKVVVREWGAIFIEKVTPAVEKFVEVAKQVIDWVRTFIKENPHSALAALGVLVAAVVIPAVLGLVAAFAALFSPVIIIVAAIAALAAGAVYAYENFETFRNIVNAVKDWLVNVLWPAIQMVAQNIVDAFKAMVAWLQENFVPIMTTVGQTLIAIWQAVADFFMEYLWPTIEVVIGFIVEAFWGVIHFFQDDFIPLVQAVVETLTAAWQAFADFFTEYVWPIIHAAFIGIASVLDNFWDVVKAMVNLVKALFSGDFAEVWRQLRTMVGEVIDAIVDLFIFLPGRILSAAKPLLGKFALIVSDFAVHLLGKIVKLIQAIPDQIVEFVGGIAQDILNLGKDIGGWIISGLIAAVKAAAQAVLDAVKSVIPDVGGMVSGAVGGAKDIGKGALSAIGGIFGLHKGGIVTSPTLALIGEKGPEAVVPLDRAGAMGTTFNITVNAGLGTDGRQVGNQIVSALKQWERTNGSLPLSVSAV